MFIHWGYNKYDKAGDNIIIDLSGIETDENCTVITLEVKGKINTVKDL